MMWGPGRDLGNERMAARAGFSCALSGEMSSSCERVECPMLYRVATLLRDRS